MKDKYQILKQTFGYDSFRQGQEKIVDAILNELDVLCVMPTGAGKSICYQVPALMLDGITIVVSPLIALMKDQVSALVQNGIAAAYVNSSLNMVQYFKVLENMKRGKYKIIYVAPERLNNPSFLEICRSVRISLLGIDEAHCISQWGQDFRPSYLKIPDFVQNLGYRPIIGAFTATATAAVKNDIEKSLNLKEPFKITTGFDRPNLRFSVIRPKSKQQAVLEVLKSKKNEVGIVYCSTRKGVEEVCEFLNLNGYSATMYHAGLSESLRHRNQDDFVYDRVQIMVATNAFGMGIDKSNVSYVVHYNMPKDMESYYQEAGRAGRDGQSAECILIYNPIDIRTNQFFIEKSDPNPEITPEQLDDIRKKDFERLRIMTFYSTTNECLRQFILKYFGECAPNYCGNCSNCLTQFDEIDITVDTQKILSCIKRTGEKYGKTIIVDVLRGSKSERVMGQGLNNQTTYGLLKEYKAHKIREIIDFLEYEDYIASTGGEYPVLTVTSKANGVLFQGEKLTMKMAKPKDDTLEFTNMSKKSKKTASGRIVNQTLLEKLKQLRKRIADEKHVPAYIVFSDATLIDMCRKLPQTSEEFLGILGVGNAKLAQYGEAFMRVIRVFAKLI